MAEQDAFGRRDTEVFPEGPTPGEPAGRRRDVEPIALVSGLLFVLIAVVLMTGVDLSLDWFGHGLTWIVLIGAGVALLVNELRKARRRR